MTIKKIILVIIGCVSFGLGVVGSVVPLMPAFPFLLLATLCFAKT